jgi:hopanoid biosynthesis associated RND transporter like protein HpnN
LAGNDDDVLSRALARWVGLSLRHGAAVVAVIAALSCLAGAAAWRWLGFNLDPNQLFSEDLRFQRMLREFEAHFPQLTDSLLIVVDGEGAEPVREASERLAERLARRGDAFTAVYFPGEEDFFEAHGLLYQSVDDLDTLTTRLATLQPVLAALARDPSLATLAWVVREGLSQPGRGEQESARLRTVLDHFRRAAIYVYSEYPLRVSWESVLLHDTPFDPSTQRVIVADPILDFGSILAAQRPIRAVRESATELGLERLGVRVRITGYPALNHEEFLGLARDTSLAGVLSFALVIAILSLAFRSLAVVAAAAAMLLCGFAWTSAWATVFVGALNPASIAFAVLFVGLGVDFMIHLGMHFAAAVRAGQEAPAALITATRETGSALVLCALTTALGFLAFLPTDYRGVSELGLISSGGMLVIVFQTLTLFPVLIVWGVRGRRLAALRARRPLALPLRVALHPGWVCGAALAATAVGLLVAPGARVEANVIALRNPNTESVQAFEDLLASDRLTPWYADILAPDLASADRLAREARALDVVARAVTLNDYVPAEQEEKLEILADAALFMDLPPGSGGHRLSDPAEQVEALRELVSFLGAPSLDDNPSELARSGRLLREQLARLLVMLEEDPSADEAIAKLEHSLLGSVPLLTERLRRSLETEGIGFEDLPRSLVERMLAADGVARVQVFPAHDLAPREAMVEFVERLREVSPDITGLPVNLLEGAYATGASLREALFWALAGIALLLALLWGRTIEIAIALAPLVFAVVLTAASARLLGVPLNFINVCVLPLLLGVGVDSGLHMVHRARRVCVASGALVGSTTAQGVTFSALTTLASFGTLVLAEHRGIASLGTLLVIGMIFTLIGNLVVLPALLAFSQRWGGSPAPEGDRVL